LPTSTKLNSLLKRLRPHQGVKRRQVAYLLISFLLSVTFWGLVTLNESYEVPISFPVVANDIPENIQLQSKLPANLEVDTRGVGLDLLIEKWQMKKVPIELDMRLAFNRGYIISRDYTISVRSRLPSTIEILRIKPDTIRLAYAERDSVRVPLIANVDIRLAPAYQLGNQPSLTPDSVTIFGPASELQEIQSWSTLPFRTEPLAGFTVLELKVDTLPGLLVRPSIAEMVLKPDLYTQTTISLKLRVVGVPRNMEVRLSHEAVLVDCLIPVRDYDSVTGRTYESLKEFNHLDREINYFLPEVSSLPPQVIVLNRKPVKVTYVIVEPDL
jgi:hypothetical protein